MALTSARGRSALQSDSNFTLWEEKKQIMNMEWIFRLKIIPSFLLSVFYLAVLLLDLSSIPGPCEPAVNQFGRLFVLGLHFASLNFRGLYFTH